MDINFFIKKFLLCISFSILLNAMKDDLTKLPTEQNFVPKFFIPTINEKEYNQIVASFVHCCWRIRYDNNTKNYKVELFPRIQIMNDSPSNYTFVAEYDFEQYRKIILDAYNNIANKQSEEITEEDPTLVLYRYINDIKNTPLNPLYMIGSLEHEKAVLNAFEKKNMSELSTIIDEWIFRRASARL